MGESAQHGFLQAGHLQRKTDLFADTLSRFDLIDAVKGQRSESVIIITTLIVASAMTPIKNSLQKAVDKRFKEVPDAHKQLRAFVAQIQARLFPVDAQQMTCRLLEEAVAAFEAKGGMATLTDFAPAHVTRAWDGDAQGTLPFRSDEKLHGRLVLSGRANGAEYSPHDRDLLLSVVCKSRPGHRAS